MTKPDWRNADDYKFTDDLTYEEWAWEFLRRNPRYRTDWAIVKERLGELGKNYPDLTLVEQHLLHKNEPLETSIAETAKKWGLEIFMSDPDYPYWILQTWTCGRRIRGPEPGWDMGDRRHLVIAFDLVAPIDDQIRMAKNWLNSERKLRAAKGEIKLINEKKDRSVIWKNYLRVLDAVSAGAVNKDKADVAKVLAPNKENSYPDYAGNKTIDNWIVAANKLRDTEYLALPSISYKNS